MSSHESDFRSVYERELVPILTEMEVERKAIVQHMWKVAIPTVIATVGLGFLHLALSIVAIIVGGATYMLTGKKRRDAFHQRFKTEVMPKVVACVNPGYSYEPSNGIQPGEYMESRLFKRSYDRYRSEDLVSGMVGETRVHFSEVHTEYKTERRDKDGNKKTTWHTIFDGLFYVADFNKPFTHPTYIYPDTMERMFGSWGRSLQKLTFSKEKLVTLEDPEFEKAFAVYGEDQVQTRYILTPALMQDLLEFKRSLGKNIYVSFVNKRMFLAFSVSGNLFEASYFKNAVSFDRMKEYYRYLRVAEHMVEQLNLNTRIWGE